MEAARVPQEVAAQLVRRRVKDNLFELMALIATLVGIVFLSVLIVDILRDGWPRLSWQFLTSYPSRKPEQAGILPALVGTLWVVPLAGLMAFVVGVMAGIYLEEFAPRNRLTAFIEINIANLAGVPSIIYGLLGLQLFVRVMEPITGGRTVLAAAMTLALLVLPIVIIATREALRAVPPSLRLAGLALGATQWQVVRDHVLPLAFPGILTGTILAVARAIGETAPLIPIGALTYVAFLPPLGLEGLRSPFTVLPIQIFNWISRPQKAFHTNAAAGIIVLLAVLLLLNGVAIYLRARLQRRF